MNVRVILGLLEMNQVEAASLLGVSDRMLRYYNTRLPRAVAKRARVPLLNVLGLDFTEPQNRKNGSGTVLKGLHFLSGETTADLPPALR
jgi:hypothetical protein